MCVTRPTTSKTRRHRLAKIPRPDQTELTSDSWSKLANSNFKSTVFDSRVHVWVLPLALSQSKYGGRQEPSSACTLITVQIAHDFMEQQIPLPPVKPTVSQNLPLAILDVLVNAIVDGNETHGKAMNIRKRGYSGSLKKKFLDEDKVPDASFFQFLKKPHRDTFTVPEAIQVQRPEMHEVDYRCYSGNFISNLVTALTMAVTSPYLDKLPRLTLGVLAYERAMCFIYDRPTHSILLMDTHMHFKGRAGSVLCVASFEDITDFVVGVTKLVFHEVLKKSDMSGQFEITCLMLTRLMNRIHRGHVFQPIKPSAPKIAPMMVPVKVKREKLMTFENSMENDSGYESEGGEII